MLDKESRRVLIADNDEDVLIALEQLLENGGYTTATALSHNEASKLLAEESFDLCVLDDYLSDNDSIGVLSELRGAESKPLVVVTYHRFPNLHEETQLRALGVTAFINKRAHSELAHIVTALLEPISHRSGRCFDDLT